MHPNLKLLSNSGSSTLHRCPRRYELDKMLMETQEDDQHTHFGKAVGLGIQELMTHGDLNRAFFTMFLQWKDVLDSEDDQTIRNKKTFWYALEAVDNFHRPLRTIFGNHELAILNGRPATELGFSIDCGDGFFYRGFIDAILYHKMSNELVVVESKTTKFSKIHEAMWKHSGQALGYSLIIDAIIDRLKLPNGAAYKVFYPVYKSSAVEWETFQFTKTHTRRALWIKSILLDIKHILEYDTEGYFPMYGESCYEFFKPCPHFGRCEFDNKLLFKEDRVKLKVEAESKYDFHFSLEEIVMQQISKGE